VIERVRSNEEIRALYDATAYLFNADTVHDLAQQIVRAVVTEFEHVDCGLLSVDLPTGQINRLARTGQYQVSVPGPLHLSGPGLVPKAIRENRIVYVPDVQQDPDYVANMPTTQSEMVVPLRTRNTVIGVLDLQSTQPDIFNQRDARILGAFAERAAAALEIIRLYEAINRHAAELELRVEARTQELQSAKERVEAILNNSSDAIILVDVDGAVQQTNPRFVETFGYDYDEMFGQSLSRIVLMEAEDDLLQILEGVASNREYRRSEVLAKRKDGSVFPADAAFAAFAGNLGTEIVCSLRDISAQKQLEQELRSAFEQQKELADLKTRFISTVSHEYRTPLTIIMTFSSLLRMYSERLTDEEKQRYLDNIQTQVKRMTALLDDVLEINRAETVGVEFTPEAIDLAGLCQEMVENTRQINPDHRIEFSIAGEPALMSGDLKLVRQIISNLLSNAVKYSPDKGQVEVNLRFEAESVALMVRDEGVGIPPEDLDNLFKLFHRAGNVGQIQGSGLGLAIVKQAVDAHQGTISVDSTVGVGTTFTVVLPM
jgi:PAS domain S-box-containing protein